MSPAGMIDSSVDIILEAIHSVSFPSVYISVEANWHSSKNSFKPLPSLFPHAGSSCRALLFLLGTGNYTG